MGLREAIQQAAIKHRCYGYRRIQVLIEREGFQVGAKKVRRLMREDNLLAVRRRKFIVTTDSVDTGERRQVGSYQARHVKTTITAEPGSEAVSHKSKTEVDGWYIDLTGLYCQDSSKQTLGWATASSGRIDRIIFKRIGTAPRGFAVEETTTRHEDGRVSINKIELIEISEKPLEESLFEVPADYSPASPKTGQ